MTDFQRKLRFGVLLAVGLVLLHHGIAGAQVTNPGDDPVEPFIGIDTWLAIIGLVTPFATAVLTKVGTPSIYMTLVSGALAGLAALTVEGLQDGELTWQRWLNGAIQILVFHLLSWKFLSGPVEATQAATANTGLPLPNNGTVVGYDGGGAGA